MTIVDVANMALTEVGTEAVLADMNDRTKEGRLCNQNFDIARRAVLAGAHWKFAVKRLQVDLDIVEVPPFGYTSRFAVPEDYIRAIEMNGHHVGWVREGRYILCNEAGPINLRYVSDEAHTELWDPLFSDCVALDLASRICYALTQSNDRTKEVKQAAMIKVRKARHTDACEQAGYGVIADEYESARIQPPSTRYNVPDVNFPPQT